MERDPSTLCLSRADWRRLEGGQFIADLPAREPRRLGHKRAGEDVSPCRSAHVSCRGVGAVVEHELLEGFAVFERDTAVNRHVEQLGRILVESVEGLDALEEEEAARERPDVSCTHDVLRGADDLGRGVRRSPPGARVLIVEVAQLDLQLAARVCEEDVGWAEVAVVHAVSVEVGDTESDGECDTQLVVE